MSKSPKPKNNDLDELNTTIKKACVHMDDNNKANLSTLEKKHLKEIFDKMNTIIDNLQDTKKKPNDRDKALEQAVVNKEREEQLKKVNEREKQSVEIRQRHSSSSSTLANIVKGKITAPKQTLNKSKNGGRRTQKKRKSVKIL